MNTRPTMCCRERRISGSRLFGIILFTLLVFAASGISAQTAVISRAELLAALKSSDPREPKLAFPYRSNYFWTTQVDGKFDQGYSRTVISDHFSATNRRNVQKELIGTKIRSSEQRFIEGQGFTRIENGPWTKLSAQPAGPVVGKGNQEASPVVPGSKEPEKNPYIRKPGSEEVLHYSLGTRLYKGQTVNVYEEMTRHALIRKSDGAEIHYEKRTRWWIAEGSGLVRRDTYDVMYVDDHTRRNFSSQEWEKVTDMVPAEIPEQFRK